MFSKAAATFDIISSSALGFPFSPHILTNTFCFPWFCLLKFNISHVNGCSGQLVSRAQNKGKRIKHRSMQDRKSFRGKWYEGLHHTAASAPEPHCPINASRSPVSLLHVCIASALGAHVVAAMLDSADLANSIITSSVDWLVLL